MGTGFDWLAGGDRREAATRAIYAAAREQLLERGPGKFTAEAVARRAGCSRATLYRVVGGKTALLDAVMTDAAAALGRRIETGVAGLEGAERISEAILIGLSELRADESVHRWVRQTVRSSDFLQGSSPLINVAASWLGGAPPDGRDARLAGEWIVRVYLSFIAWPAPDEVTEARLVREFVAPAFAG
ncbi:TetR/AcrR family transcriptional regulator [Nocardioides ferulae]|uniref:TetR/AcrR family transcriptional regulator n=1 Tax=Nocardioides ferulae TaxID=2340821 RepID=UPI0013DD9828|nr:TetR/AcrR family transcriptional regulator [Nocardioides ferulae]